MATEGILMSSSGAVFTAPFVASLEARIATRATAAFIAERVAISLLTPRITKFIPYVGWAIMIGTAAYAGYEAYKSTEIDWGKLENGVYDAQDLTVFRMGFTVAQQRFLATAAGAAAVRNRSKYILIPSEVMPTVAQVDSLGITQFGNSLTWDPAGANQRRYQAVGKRGSAGIIFLANGTRVRGSWEEYPFAVTYAPIPGAVVDLVPLREQWIQGGFIRAADIVQAFKPSDNVLCYIL
jgi:hypothetical protein